MFKLSISYVRRTTYVLLRNLAVREYRFSKSLRRWSDHLASSEQHTARLLTEPRDSHKSTWRGPPPIIIISLRKCCNTCEMDTTPWNNHHQDAAGSRENGGHYYGSNVPYVDSLSAILASASGLIINQAFQAPIQPTIIVQYARAPSPQPTSVAMMPSSFALGRSEPSAPGQPQSYTPGPGHTVDGFMPQANHLQPSVLPPYTQHQPVQETLHYPCVYYPSAQVQLQVPAFSHGSSRREINHQPSPEPDSCPRGCSSEPRGKSKELFVRHLPFNMTEEELRGLFSQNGVVTRASIALHPLSGQPCYAFVKFKLQSAADNAIMRLNKFPVSIM